MACVIGFLTCRKSKRRVACRIDFAAPRGQDSFHEHFPIMNGARHV
jgi:hypothetical protein